MKQGMFTYGMFIGLRDRNKVLGLKSPDRRIWAMTGCSALSGQMTFKDVTSRGQSIHEDDLEESLKHPSEKFGITNTGEIDVVCRSLPYAELLAKGAESSRLLKLGIGEDPFLTTDEGFPYLTDGHVGYRVEWTANRITFRAPLTFGHKVLRMIVDPVNLEQWGKVLSPIQPAIDLIEKHEDVLCDPFADRNMSKTGTSIARQIMPGMRQKVRAVTRKLKGVAP
jgi:hypothetical protein